MLVFGQPFLRQILQVLNIACAPVALATAKGGKNHRRWGKIYFWAMAGVGATALILSLALPISFLPWSPWLASMLVLRLIAFSL